MCRNTGLEDAYILAAKGLNMDLASLDTVKDAITYNKHNCIYYSKTKHSPVCLHS